MFEIINVSESNYNQYVFLLDSEDLDYEIYDIYDALKTTEKEVRVLVDCFLRTGNSYNRFIELKFNDGKFENGIIINPRDVDDYIKQKTMQELSLNKNLLDESALSKREIEIIKSLL